MNYLDIVIAILLLYGLIKGFTNGLIKEITGLLGLIIGVYVAINFSSYLHPKFEEILGGYEQFIPIIAFATLFIVSVLKYISPATEFDLIKDEIRRFESFVFHKIILLN